MRRQGHEDISVKKLPEKRGHSLLLGEELEMQIRAYLNGLRANGAVVNTAIARCKDSNLLACNGGHISLSKHWGKHLLSHMG